MSEDDRLAADLVEGRVVLRGELDLATVPAAERAVADALGALEPGAPLIVDLSGLRFMDSQGLRLLFTAAVRLPSSSRVVVEGARGQIARVLQIAGVDQHPKITVATAAR